MSIADAARSWTPAQPYLDTASYGLPPASAWEALQTALADWRGGRTSWEVWDAEIARARALFGQLVSVPAERVAVAATVSELVGLVAASTPRGDVVCAEGDFTSLLWPWAAQGFELRSVPLDRVAEAVGPGTAVVAVSAVQSSTGALVDLDAVAGAAAEHGALSVVDATQACGWLPLDASRFDAVVCAGYKWLCAPRGTAYLTVGERVLERTTPLHAGWYAGVEPYGSYYGLPLTLAPSARRLDTSPAWFSWVGGAPALQALLDAGVEEIQAHDVGLANRFRAGLGLPPGDSAIVPAAVADAGPRLERAGIRASTRAGSVRASFHLYTTAADVDAALDALVG